MTIDFSIYSKIVGVSNSVSPDDFQQKLVILRRSLSNVNDPEIYGKIVAKFISAKHIYQLRQNYKSFKSSIKLTRKLRNIFLKMKSQVYRNQQIEIYEEMKTLNDDEKRIIINERKRIEI